MVSHMVRQAQSRLIPECKIRSNPEASPGAPHKRPNEQKQKRIQSKNKVELIYEDLEIGRKILASSALTIQVYQKVPKQ